MGDVSNIQALIGRGGRIEGVEDQVGTIWEGIHLEKHISRQGSALELQTKEEIDKVKSRALKEKALIKGELQSTIAFVKNMDQGQRQNIKSIKI